MQNFCTIPNKGTFTGAVGTTIFYDPLEDVVEKGAIRLKMSSMFEPRGGRFDRAVQCTAGPLVMERARG
ncbi:MAG: hypothetical protein GY820_19970 [Gammaproteobacteria bacterium]|nr:hypothetical protein [Gammaproteobacteria bacterium]